MPINLTVNDGEITPYLKYNAKAGRFYVKPAAGGEDIEITNPKIAIDMENIRTGWIFYAEGAGPEKVWDAAPDKSAPRPSGPKRWKRGFEVMVYSTAAIANGERIGLREWSSTANNAIAAILKMHGAYEAGVKANVGKIPVYQCQRVIAVQGAYGTNYEPEFILTAWVDRIQIPAFDEHLEARGSVSASGPTEKHDVLNPPRQVDPQAIGARAHVQQQFGNGQYAAPTTQLNDPRPEPPAPESPF